MKLEDIKKGEGGGRVRITYKMLMAKKPCYDPKTIKWYNGEDFELIDVFKVKISRTDKIWLVTKFLPDLENRKFAIWCVRRYKTDCEALNDYIDDIEGYYIRGDKTKDELTAANLAAYRATARTTASTAYWAAYSAADRAAYSAAVRAADWAADWTTERKAQVKKLKSIVERLRKEAGE